MFKIDQKTNKISITKGDNAELELTITDDEGKVRQLFQDDKIELTVRKNADAEEVIHKTANGNTISFEPADTNNVPVGNYKYDIQLTTFTGKIYTVIPSSYFEVMEGITR